MVTITTPYLPSPDAVSPRLLGLPGLRCALVRCGTSRAVILRGEELPQDDTREYFLRRVMDGESVADSLGGEHYQLNKLAVISPLPSAGWFSFRFYQYDRHEGRLAPDMECANVSAGAALTALVDGVVTPDADGVVHAINEGTGQQIDLRASDRFRPWASTWEVRFVHPDGLRVQSFSGEEPLVAIHPSGIRVNFWVARLGNLFVLANTAPEEPDPDLLDHLAAAGSGVEGAVDVRAHDGPAPKLLLYRTEYRETTEAWVSAACYYAGERHQSLPGSGAMCLASFLTLSHLYEARPEGYQGTFTCNLRHPSGDLAVSIEWRRTANDYQIVSTAFVTPVRLLLFGIAPLPASGRS